jgi:hypothetical protein
MIDRLIPTANYHDLPDDAVKMQLNVKAITFDSECTRTRHEHQGRTRND